MSILVTCFWNTSNKSNQWKYHMESFFLKLGANVICICSVFNLLFCKRLHFLSYQSYMEMVIVIITIGYMGAQTEQETQSKFLKIWISSLVSLESYSFLHFGADLCSWVHLAGVQWKNQTLILVTGSNFVDGTTQTVFLHNFIYILHG